MPHPLITIFDVAAITILGVRQQAAAKAHKEGGFLGVGAKQVSEEEQAVLDDLATTLGLT